MANIDDTISILDSLRQLIADDPELLAFAPAADAVLGQAQAIARGELDIPAFEVAGSIPIGRNVPKIPTRNHAVALRVTFDRLPSIETHGDERLAYAYATLLRNAYISVLHAIFTQYPDVLPRPLRDGEP
jgi:hypothetical protein